MNIDKKSIQNTLDILTNLQHLRQAKPEIRGTTLITYIVPGLYDE